MKKKHKKESAADRKKRLNRYKQQYKHFQENSFSFPENCSFEEALRLCGVTFGPTYTINESGELVEVEEDDEQDQEEFVPLSIAYGNGKEEVVLWENPDYHEMQIQPATRN